MLKCTAKIRGGVERDMSSGFTLAGEKVKHADLRRQDGNLFGPKLPEKHTKVISCSTKSNQRDRDRREKAAVLLD